MTVDPIDQTIADHDDFGGLSRDLGALVPRRRMLALLAGGGVLALSGCGSDATSSSSSPGAATETTTSAVQTTGGGSATTSATEITGVSETGAAATCEVIPRETAGPYPGDGSNGPNILTESGVVRSDITASIGSASGVADGVALSVTLAVTGTADQCTALAGAAVYLWHCTRDGLYSLYSQGVEEENFLRGVQATDANGRATFQTIFPGAYSGRWPHIHFEVYASLDAATSGQQPLATSQIALPAEACGIVYATEGYEDSVTNFAQTPLDSDNVFGDDSGVSQTPTSAGDVTSGFDVELVVPV